MNIFIYLLILMETSNINISSKNIAGKCDSKCSYQFNYSESSSTAKNNGVSISLSYDTRSTPPVVYNTQKYSVSNIEIVSPSIHTFNDVKASGEIIIYHSPQTGGNNLNVCIPLSTSGDLSNASETITAIIKKVASNAPSEGDTTNLNMNFSLQTIVPKKPFYTYTNSSTDYILFGTLDAISISSATLEVLQQIIQPYNLATPGDALYYNSRGPTSGIDLGGGLYISCQPTGSSVEETPVMREKNSTSTDFSNLFSSPIFKWLIVSLVGIIVFVIVFYSLGMLYKYITNEPIEIEDKLVGKLFSKMA